MKWDSIDFHDVLMDRPQVKWGSGVSLPVSYPLRWQGFNGTEPVFLFWKSGHDTYPKCIGYKEGEVRHMSGMYVPYGLKSSCLVEPKVRVVLGK